MQIETIMSHYYIPSIKKTNQVLGQDTEQLELSFTGGSDFAKWYNQHGKLATSDKVKEARDL